MVDLLQLGDCVLNTKSNGFFNYIYL